MGMRFNYFIKCIRTHPSSTKEQCAHPNSKNDYTYRHKKISYLWKYNIYNPPYGQKTKCPA